jgi:hypothetical protein
LHFKQLNNNRPSKILSTLTELKQLHLGHLYIDLLAAI